MEDFDKAIGVMDSGVGGLTVLKELYGLCPDENFLYFGDTKNLPYGEKTKEELIEIVKEIFDFFEHKNVKAVVLACNTTSATAYDELKDKYSFKIYPLIQIVSKCVAKNSTLSRIGVMATQATINSHKYKTELQKNNPDILVYEQACPLWVPIVEKQLTDYDEKTAIKGYLDKVLEFNPQKIILGCTHYPYLLDKISKYAPKDLFINPAKLFAQYIKEDLNKNNMQTRKKCGCITYFASSEPENFKKNAKMFMEIDSQPTLVNI